MTNIDRTITRYDIDGDGKSDALFVSFDPVTYQYTYHADLTRDGNASSELLESKYGFESATFDLAVAGTDGNVDFVPGAQFVFAAPVAVGSILSGDKMCNNPERVEIRIRPAHAALDVASTSSLGVHEVVGIAPGVVIGREQCHVSEKRTGFFDADADYEFRDIKW